MQNFIVDADRQGLLKPKIENLIRDDASFWEKAVARLTHGKLLRVIEEGRVTQVEDYLKARKRVWDLYTEAMIDELRSYFASEIGRLNLRDTSDLSADGTRIFAELQTEIANTRDIMARRCDARLLSIEKEINNATIQKQMTLQVFADLDHFVDFTDSLFEKTKQALHNTMDKYRPQPQGPA